MSAAWKSRRWWALTRPVPSGGRGGAADGFICTVAALVATRINPSCRQWLLFGHRGAEPGHRRVLAELDGEPLLELGLRLGEGSGAALAVLLLRLACDLHGQMATFAEAAVADRPARSSTCWSRRGPNWAAAFAAALTMP